ncbi:transporter substrate-binding domain-containing protein [Alteromonas pelagimontana]|uniref:Transporter substrate-binding domain-containing protein n=1 Tax=Alteromonas pelagimontana TaxID=1858656 RepID=A0A6M4MA72_9ALTE|nr:transporter substrate-binding domain-containing protein [Alteromonas pelagimontana]QJR80073.1 transporter substrate-binding domain-containing protein [Alteromonas pelagimontana]
MRLLLTFLILLTLIPTQAFAHAWLKLKIATTEYAPYTSTSMEHSGYINHIITQAFLETGVVVEFTAMSWEEALEATRKGEYDAVSYGNFIRSREREFWHSDPISVENLVFYVNKKTGPKNWQALSDLKQYKMGITKDYLYTDEIEAYVKSAPTIVTAPTDNANFDALINGDIDLFPIDQLTGWYILQKDFNEIDRASIQTIEPRISSVTTHLLVPKGNADERLILELFNKGLKQLKLQGEMERFKTLLREGFYQYPEKPVNYDRR